MDAVNKAEEGRIGGIRALDSLPKFDYLKCGENHIMFVIFLRSLSI